MRFKSLLLSVLLLLTMVISIMPPPLSAENYLQNFSFQTQYGFLGQKLYVSIQPSLYLHYSNATHVVNSDADYTQFVTPQTVKPIADSIRRYTDALSNSDEQFANAVLSLVHQIPYQITGAKYPVETLIKNSGDCVSLSLLAASILQAGGLDVVLIHYTGINPSHLNVGVYLPNPPVFHNILSTPTGVEYDNKTYWTAEATPESDWKVGDQADQLANAKPEVISLNNTEQSSPGQISASFDAKPAASSITLNLAEQSPIIQNITRSLVIRGSISPAIPNQRVAIYLDQNSSFASYREALTDDFGNYATAWNLTSSGTYYITASWSGTQGYAGTDSETLTVFVGPASFLQFGTPDYTYILAQTNILYYLFGPASIINYTLPALQGENDFLRVPLDANVSFTYEFQLLRTGHDAVNFSSKTEPLQVSEKIVNTPRGRRHEVILQSSNQTQTVPTNIPDGMGPLTIPKDFNQTINNQFCFLIQGGGSGNFSLNMKALNAYDVANITESNTALLNISGSIKENSWYSVTETISNNWITAQVKDENGTLIQSFATPYNSLALVVANNVDNAIVFKNLRFGSNGEPNQSTPSATPREVTQKAASKDGWFLFTLVLTMLIISTVWLVAFACLRRKKK